MRHDILRIASISRIVMCGLIVFGILTGISYAAITADQKKELKEISQEIAKAGGLTAKKKFDEAASAVQEVESRIAKFVKDANLKETDPLLKPIHIQLEKVREKITKASGKGGVSFEKNVASILSSKCVGCHGEEPRGGFRLDTFEGLEKGGQSGQLVVPGNVETSLLVQRLVTQDDQLRMPKGKEALTEKEINTIATWIADGAKFEGDKSATLAALIKAAASNKPAAAAAIPRKSEISKETGKETVHFTQDLMPEMMDTCGRCHNDTVKRSGFSVVSFEKLMKGGDSGAVIVPGKLEESRLWRLVNGDDTPVMPAGNQTGVTRKWYDNLRTWILEGAKYDGSDAKKNFPSREERDAAALAKFTPEQWLERRKKSTEAQWKKTFPNAEPNIRESDEFLIYGDVSDDRLERIEKWSNEHLAYLRQTFKTKDEPVWKGKLAIFVFKERFGYEEFNSSVHRRDVPREVIGHSEITGKMEEVFIALQDVGDAESENSPGMHVNVIDHMTGIFFKRGGDKLPDWLIRGAGLALARQKAAGNPFLASMPRLAGGILQESKLADPAQLFADGAFSPGEVGPIGLTLVEFLLKRGSILQFGQLIQRFQSGATADAAIKEIYQTEPKALALAYATSLPSGVKKSKK